MQQRKAFIDEYFKREQSMSELCRRFGVSRKTAYKWVDRFRAGCELEDRSRRPHKSPKAVVAALEDAIVAARKERPNWGPKKLRAVLSKAHPSAELPSISTFALILKRNGFVTPRRRRRRASPSPSPLSHAAHPNALWCIDFKGDFSVGPRRCYPLTVTDAYSRFLLGCVALPNTRTEGVRKALQALFQTFGLPEAIRSDNGSPFASKAPAGLSELSAWWLALGIRHERIEPGKPQQNGRHERMHLTLKHETVSPPATSFRAQQRLFDRFRREFNELRPHEALGQRFPAEFYRRSSRVLPQPHWGRDFDYPEEFECVRVRKSGHLPWNDRSAFVSTVLKHQLLGLHWQAEGYWRVFFRTLPIGTLAASRSRLLFSSP